MFRSLTVVFALAMLAPPARTQGITFFTTGDGSCGEWVEARTESHIHWLNGYLSGINSGKGGRTDMLKGVTPSSVSVWMDNYCRSNPLERVSQAANLLASELLKRQSGRASK